MTVANPYNKGEDWQKRAKAAPGLPKDEDEKLKAKYDPELKKAQARLDAAGKQALEKGGLGFAMQMAKHLMKFKPD